MTPTTQRSGMRGARASRRAVPRVDRRLMAEFDAARDRSPRAGHRRSAVSMIAAPCSHRYGRTIAARRLSIARLASRPDGVQPGVNASSRRSDAQPALMPLQTRGAYRPIAARGSAAAAIQESV